jgi:glycosyltransferase involved in cell wall biosynthesis
MRENSIFPLVDIAIVTYNQVKFLEECIESCLSQDYPNFQIVVADDGSSDGTHELLTQYSDRYPGKFILRLSKVNKGITNNSNSAHFACSGKYIAWMGGDDLMMPGKIMRQVDFMESNPDCTISYHNLDVFDSDTNKTIYFFNEKNKFEGDFSTCIKNGAFNGACSTMVRRDKVPENGFCQYLPVASDWLYWIETLANGGSINYIDEVLGRYRRHSGNVTAELGSKISQNDLDHLLCCQLLIRKFPENFDDVMSNYGRLLLGIRNKVNYTSALKFGFLLRPSVVPLGAFLLNLITLGRYKP